MSPLASLLLKLCAGRSVHCLDGWSPVTQLPTCPLASLALQCLQHDWAADPAVLGLRFTMGWGQPQPKRARIRPASRSARALPPERRLRRSCVAR